MSNLCVNKWRDLQIGIMAPCKDCEYRHEACHANCDQYMAYRVKVYAYRERRNVTKEADTIAIESCKRRTRFKRQ